MSLGLRGGGHYYGEAIPDIVSTAMIALVSSPTSLMSLDTECYMGLHYAHTSGGLPPCNNRMIVAVEGPHIITTITCSHYYCVGGPENVYPAVPGSTTVLKKGLSVRRIAHVAVFFQEGPLQDALKRGMCLVFQLAPGGTPNFIPIYHSSFHFSLPLS